MKAQSTFERFRQNLDTDQNKAGAIQAFEFCFELAWKTMQEIVREEGVEVLSPKGAFRASVAIGLISDFDVWFDFLMQRNETVHAYKEDVRDKVLSIFDDFSRELSFFIKTAEERA